MNAKYIWKLIIVMFTIKIFSHMNYVVMNKNQVTLKVYKYRLVEIKV